MTRPSGRVRPPSGPAVPGVSAGRSATVAPSAGQAALQSSMGMAGLAPAAIVIQGPRERRMTPLRLLGTPVVICLALVLLYVWVHRHPLDSIEQRTLNESYLQTAVLQHLKVAGSSALLILLIALPLGVVLSRRSARYAAPFVLVLANIGQATPVIGVLTLIIVGLNVNGFGWALVAFVPYGVLPILRNTIVGLQQIDENLIEAARGIGMRNGQILRKIELPLAVPVLLAGVRTALTLTVAVTVLATFINAGGLGDIIVNGLKLGRNPVLVTGAALTVSIALIIDWLARLVEDLLRPRGL